LKGDAEKQSAMCGSMTITVDVAELYGVSRSTSTLSTVGMDRSSSANSPGPTLALEKSSTASHSAVSPRLMVLDLDISMSIPFFATALARPLIAKKARTFAAMLSVSGATILVDDVYADEALNFTPRDSLTMIQRNLVAIIVVSPPEIMFVPGVVAYITAVMAHNNINILHIESSYTDTVIVVSKEDALRAFSVISEHVELARSVVGHVD